MEDDHALPGGILFGEIIERTYTTWEDVYIKAFDREVYKEWTTPCATH